MLRHRRAFLEADRKPLSPKWRNTAMNAVMQLLRIRDSNRGSIEGSFPKARTRLRAPNESHRHRGGVGDLARRENVSVGILHEKRRRAA
jgi:hypothetical protein